MATATAFSDIDSYVVPFPLDLLEGETNFSVFICSGFAQLSSTNFIGADAFASQTQILSEFNELDKSLREARQMTPEALQLQRCLSEIQLWLGVGLNFATKLSGISRATFYAWKLRGSTPRQSTLASVLNFHSLVKYSINSNGSDATRTLFNSGNPSYIQSILNSANAEELSLVIRSIRRDIFKTEIPDTNSPLAVVGKDRFPFPRDNSTD